VREQDGAAQLGPLDLENWTLRQTKIRQKIFSLVFFISVLE
jgi:hypothetical protein